MEEKIESMISLIFSQYDMRTGDKNKIRMEKVLNYCMNDITEHPFLANSLKTNEAIKFFVLQTILYLIPTNE